MPDTPHDATAIPDAAAQRLIARAIELDARRTAEVPVAQLREAVLEAGVSPAAFDAAFAELRATLQAGSPAPLPVAPEPPRGRIAGSWARVRDRVRGAEPPTSTAPATMPERVSLNIVALLAFWGMLVLLMKLGGAADAAWPAQKLGALLGAVLGAGIAHRIGARFAKWALVAVAVGETAEFAADLLFGTPAVLGAGSHWAMFIAGALGVGVGALLGRTRHAPPATPTSCAAARATAGTEAEPAPASDTPPRRLLRLRHA